MPQELAEFMKKEAKEIGIPTNALIVQILWDYKNKNTKEGK